MAAKVQWDREAWWVFTHYEGKRRKKRVGPTKIHKREAERIAEKVNAAIALGTFTFERKPQKPLPCNTELRRWHTTYSPTFKPSFEQESDRIIEQHLAPFFGSIDLREIREDHLLRYIRAKLRAGAAVLTIQTQLSILRRVLSLAHQEAHLERNPAARLGTLMRRVDRSKAAETKEVDSWTHREVETLLDLAGEHEPRLYACLAVLLSTGLRRGELLGLKWEDVDFESRRLHVRRAVVRGQLTTPKSGKGRHLALPPGLASLLLDLLAVRRREMLPRGWPGVPEWVFPSNTGGHWDEDNFDRSWRRLRRRAQKHGVRPLKLHCTRHTWASMALAAGKSVRWVADQLGHASPMLTLKTYAHAMREEEGDLGFADFASRDSPKRPYTAPHLADDGIKESAPDATHRGHWRILEHETGLEPATPTLATWRSTN
jgi:integrase